ncbi:hypothetical protein QIS74_10646 [Colletotrichum tabaci]|uniref:Uncharacterized protein n=1 Tax=Colletotrichum tabaci TaxID=1209068 RepID=A0AAV9T118_9PEZI
MEAASRLALLAVVARAGSPLPKDEKAPWSPSSAAYLPLITVEDCDVEAGGGGHWEGKRLLYQNSTRSSSRRGSGGRGRDDDAAGHGSGVEEGGLRTGGLESVAWWVLLCLECLLIGAVEGWIIYMVYDGGDYVVWNWLCDYASPALVILFSVALSAALLRGVGCSGRLGDLAFQAAGLVLATFCTVVVCVGVGEGRRRRRRRGKPNGERGDEEKGLRVVVGLAVKMWFLFFIGFWCAVFQWYSADKQERRRRTAVARRKGKRVGYGTTLGALATVDEACEGVVGDL